jgi:hypothetical protein
MNDSSFARIDAIDEVRVRAMCGPIDRQSAKIEVESFEKLLVIGGDEPIAVADSIGRNRYGTPPGMANDEIWFSSSTANAISPRGHKAALRAYQSKVRECQAGSMSEWFDDIRARLNGLFGISRSEVVLAASGAELELIALFLARTMFVRPLTNIVVAPDETGRGVLLAAAGRNFLGSTPFAEAVGYGSLIEGLGASDQLTETVQIRDEQGVRLSSDSIDRLIEEKVKARIADGRSVLVHLLDCSKTNYGGLQRSTASALMKQHPGQILVVVDACQLRCSPKQIKADLQAGFMVMITGSKFAGGPPFSGALLLSPTFLDHIETLDLPFCLRTYSSAEDWPATLRQRIRGAFDVQCNVGVGLRWEARLG